MNSIIQDIMDFSYDEKYMDVIEVSGNNKYIKNAFNAYCWDNKIRIDEYLRNLDINSYILFNHRNRTARYISQVSHEVKFTIPSQWDDLIENIDKRSREYNNDYNLSDFVPVADIERDIKKYGSDLTEENKNKLGIDVVNEFKKYLEEKKKFIENTKVYCSTKGVKLYSGEYKSLTHLWDNHNTLDNTFFDTVSNISTQNEHMTFSDYKDDMIDSIFGTDDIKNYILDTLGFRFMSEKIEFVGEFTYGDGNDIDGVSIIIKNI